MEYIIGSHVDLTSLNRKEVAATRPKSLAETVERWQLVGTSYAFKLTQNGLKAARRIEVATA